MLGLALFGIASAIIALAPDPAALLAGRTLQGVAAALAVPSTLAAVGANAAPERRAGAIAAWSGFLMLGFSLGPLFGGATTHFLGWRLIFWANLLLMLVALAGLAASPAAPARPRIASRIDWAGFVLLAGFMVSLVFGLQALPAIAAAPLAALLPLLLAAGLLAALLQVERRQAAPLLVLDFFRRRRFVSGVATGSISMFSIIALLLYFNLFAQSPEGLGETPLLAGATLLPLGLALLAGALSAARIAGRIGLRNAMTAGMVLLALGAALLAAAMHARGPALWAGLLVIGAGLALPYAAAPRLALSALAPEQAGKGAGIINACTFLAGSLGVAIGAIARASGGFAAVLVMLAAAGLAGAILARGIEAEPVRAERRAAAP